MKPYGLIFAGKSKKGKSSKFFFQTSEIERYITAHYTNLIVCMNSCKNNNDGDKVELKKLMNWYAEIRRTLHMAGQLLIN